MGTSGSWRAPRAVRISIAVAVATVAGLTALVAPVDGRADATTPACTPTANALGAATGWTEFVEGNGTRTSESEGAIAYGGNHSASGMTLGTRLPSSTAGSAPTLVVAGTHGSYNLQRGSAYLTPQSGVNFNGGAGAGYLAANPIDFATAFAGLRATSTTWAAATSTGTVTAGTAGGNAALVLTGSDPALNVFNLTSGQVAALGSGTHVAYAVPAGSTVLVNVPGTAVTIGGQMWIGSGGGAQQANDSNTIPAYAGIVWNFAQATSVTVAVGSSWAGSILAPNAALTIATAGHTIGQMIAKSFSSGYETHQNLFPSTACVPGPPLAPPGLPDVTITKTASTATPHGGDSVTYTLTAQNVGASTATGVVIRDQLPAGVAFASASAPCTQAAGVVTCPVGDLAAGASTTVTVTVVADPIAGAGAPSHPQATHWLTPYKVEAQVDLAAGEQRSVTLSCRSGDILSDGSFRVDQVDQGTGTLDDVHVLSAQGTGLGLGSWKGVVRNDATGRAQAKAFIVCLPALTDAADRQTGYDDRHQHALSADPVLVSVTQALGVGSAATATATCPAGTVPIAPGFDLTGGSATLAASEHDATHPRDWTFRLDVTAPTTATFTVRCLRTTVSQVYGHTHDLRFTHVVKTVTVAGHTAKEGDEFQVICPDDGKGVVATWDVPPGVHHFGNDPRLKERAFRLFNATGTTKSATVDLICLHDRTTSEDMGTTDPVVVPNTATVTSVSADANAFNNSSTATITVQPGSATAGLVGSGRVAGAAFSVQVVSSMPGRGALTVRAGGARAGGAVLAQGRVALRPGRAATASLRLTAAGQRRLATLDRVSVRVDPDRGRTITRTVRVLR